MTDTKPPETRERRTPTEGITAPAQVPAGADDTGRFSAYDKTYLKYVGGVHDSKAKATKAAKDAGVEDFEIVEV